jgi:hypothetical protein
MHAGMRISMLASLLALSALAAIAQDASGKIEGVVVDSATGQPVPAAHISMVLEDRVPDFFTDASGGFRVEGLMPDRYRLVVQHTGYRDSKRNVALTEESPSAKLTIRLTPLSEITGQVLNEEGRPMSGVLVYTSLGGLLQATTDANGRYRIADLAPGDYLVHCRLAFAMREKLLERNEKTGEVMGYADTYYFPGIEDRERAIRTTVTPGVNSGGVDFRLRRTLLVEFNGRVLDRATGAPLNAAAVELQAGVLTDQTRQRRRVEAGGSFRFELIPPGRYTLAVWREGAKPPEQMPGISEAVRRALPGPERPVHVPVEIGRGGLAGAEMRIPAYVDLTMNVTAPHPERTSGRFLITMTRPDDRAVEAFAMPPMCEVGRPCMLHDVPPGQWILALQGHLTQTSEPPHVLAVESIRFGQQDAWNAPMTVAEGGNPPVEISVTDQVGTISGTVSMGEGRPADSSTIVFRRVGDDRPQRRNWGGSMILLDGLLPGDYELALFGPADDEEGGIRTAPIERCGDRVAKVTVTAGQTTNVTLRPCVL